MQPKAQPRLPIGHTVATAIIQQRRVPLAAHPRRVAQEGTAIATATVHEHDGDAACVGGATAVDEPPAAGVGHITAGPELYVLELQAKVHKRVVDVGPPSWVDAMPDNCQLLAGVVGQERWPQERPRNVPGEGDDEYREQDASDGRCPHIHGARDIGSHAVLSHSA